MEQNWFWMNIKLKREKISFNSIVKSHHTTLTQQTQFERDTKNFMFVC